MIGIDRVSATDRTFLAADTGPVPGQIGVLLMLDDGSGPDVQALREVLGQRIAAVPRLRQRIVATPLGCGPPVWLDDDTFDLARHVRAVAAPGLDEQGVLDLAVDVLLARLPPGRPLWAATLVLDAQEQVTAIVIVMHHALADGVGGLGILAALVDEAPTTVAGPRSSMALPARWDLARDAAARRRQAVRALPGTWRQLRASMRGAGGLRPPRVPDTLLLRRTGDQRAARCVTIPRAPLRDAAHRAGATTNDLVLVAIARAVRSVLLTRGEDLRELVVTVPVSGRARDPAAVGGNLVSPVLVTVPAHGRADEAVQAVTAAVRARKADGSGPPPIALVGWAFRPAARLGAYRAYLRHQHRFHTLVGHIRGPDHVVHLAGAAVTRAVPLAVGEGGNTPLAFEVLSYVGDLAVAAIADPVAFPELDLLADRLTAELTDLART